MLYAVCIDILAHHHLLLRTVALALAVAFEQSCVGMFQQWQWLIVAPMMPCCCFDY